MLRLVQISAVQFKNHFNAPFFFRKKVVGICGPNGAGKTNLLDAVYYLCFTKSYFAGSDQALPHHGQAGFRLSGRFEQDEEPVQVVCLLRETGKKECSWNEVVYPKISSHIGRLPAVMIAPDDVSLITGTSDNRRRLVDGLLCQVDARYLQLLMEYNKLMQQRNSLLKQMAETGTRSNGLLEVLTDQLVERGVYILQARHRLLASFLPQAAAHYRLIAGGHEMVQLSYLSCLPEGAGAPEYARLLQDTLAKDLVLQRTTAGIHRDDLELQLEGRPFKQIASQGQRKSLLFALKLTEFEWLQQQRGVAPILLLDDVFEKLDHQRMTNLLREVCIEKDGQVFITDTHRSRLEAQLSAIGADFEIINIPGPAAG